MATRSMSVLYDLSNTIFHVWPLNDGATREENVTMRLSDCHGEFAGPMEPPA